MRSHEPFAYELVREAWLQRGSNPRAALVTAITALEVAVKQFIARTGSSDAVERSGDGAVRDLTVSSPSAVLPGPRRRT
jgi:hypothetical protein